MSYMRRLDLELKLNFGRNYLRRVPLCELCGKQLSIIGSKDRLMECCCRNENCKNYETTLYLRPLTYTQPL